MISKGILDKWKERWTFINIPGDEILNYTQKDFDNKIAYYAEQGYTDLILSCAHWRWSFRPWWDQINLAISQVTKACHKYRIRTIEHHSSSLVYSYLNDGKGPNYYDNELDRSSKYFPGLKEYILADNDTIEGIPISSFRQISGKTGEWETRGYHTYAFCYNNPDFRRFYFEYLESIYALGVDGIMTDDIEIYSRDACTCPHCRKLFLEETGYSLPDPAYWAEIADDFSNPVYVAFQKFRHETTRRFQFDVNKHFESMGLKLARPNYVFRCLGSNLSAYPFEAAGPLWTLIMQENAWGLKTGHLNTALEAIHRCTMAKRYKTAATSLFYPLTNSEHYFAFALAWSWGQSYTGSGSGVDIDEMFRQFESKHWSSLFGCQKQADLAFYFSAETRDFTADSYENYQKPFLAWMQGAYLSGLGTDMVFEKDGIEELRLHKTIVAPHIAMISDAGLARLNEYVRGGGRLVIIEPFGKFRSDGSERMDTLSIFGFHPIIETLATPTCEDLININLGMKIRGAYVNKYFSDTDGADCLLTNQSGKIAAVRKSCGEGEIIYLPSSITGQEYQESIVFCVIREETPGVLPKVDATPYMADLIKDNAGAFLLSLFDNKVISIATENPDLLGFCYTNADETAQIVHILNTTGTLEKESRKISDHEDIVAFSIQDDNKLTYPVHVNAALCGDLTPAWATVSTPERPDSIQLPVTIDKNRLSFTIPAGFFSGYALAEIKNVE